MNIGDLFMRVLADTREFESDLNRKAGKAGDVAGTTLGQRMSGGVKKAGSGIFAGLGIGAGVAAFGALDTAISSSIRFMGDSITAARQDEESIARLGASLKANIPNWDGNTRAIESTILARQKLGFADEEQRKSLAILAAATHNVTQSLDINRVAMDLSRLKGISLEEASTALVKVEAGQYRALKALGIQLPKNATATQALAAVTRVAKGSAEAYANTSQGQLLISQIKVGEAMEKLGYVLMPVVTVAATVLADAVTTVAEALFGMGAAADGAAPKTKGLFDNLDQGFVNNTAREFEGLGKVIHDFTTGLTPLGTALENNLTPAPVANFAAAMHQARGSVEATWKGLETSSSSFGLHIRTIFGEVNAGYKTMRDEMTNAANGFADALWDPVLTKAELATNELEAKRLRNVLNSKKSSTAEKIQAQADLDAVNKRHFELLGILTSYGDAAARKALETQISVLEKTKNLTNEQKVLLAQLKKELHDAYLQALNLNSALHSGRNQGGGVGGGKERGGPVKARVPYIVGEKRPELFIPETDGTILPRVPATAAGGGGHIFNIYNPVPHAADEDIGRMLQRTAVLGL